jgi:O-antigen/teichoic acid export membrane protein
MGARRFFSASSGDGSMTQRAAWLIIAKTLAFVSSFMLPLILVRQMSQAEFGLYKQAFLVAGTVVTIFPLGFAMSAFYFLPREAGRKEQVVFNILLVYLLVGISSALLIALAPGLLLSIFHSAEIAQYSPLIGLAILFLVASSFVEYVAIANGDVRLAAALVVAIQLSRMLFLIGAAVLVGSLTSLLIAAVLHGAVQMGITLWYLTRRFPRFWRRWSWDLMRAQLAYAIPLGGAGLLAIAQEDLHHYVVSNRFDAAAYAVYAVGCMQIPLLLVFRDSVGTVMIARVAALRQAGATREIVNLTARMLRKLAVILFPLYFLLLVTGRELITVLFTAEYIQSWPIFAINLTLIPSLFLATAYDPILRAYPEHFAFLLKARAVLVVVLFGGLWWATGRFGLLGAISAVVSVSMLERVIVGIKVTRILRLGAADWVLLKDVGWILVSATAGALVAIAAKSALASARPLVVLAITGAVFIAIYGLAIVRLKILTSEEVLMIQRRFERIGLRPSLRAVSVSAKGASGL